MAAVQAQAPRQEQKQQVPAANGENAPAKAPRENPTVAAEDVATTAVVAASTAALVAAPTSAPETGCTRASGSKTSSPCSAIAAIAGANSKNCVACTIVQGIPASRTSASPCTLAA